MVRVLILAILAAVAMPAAAQEAYCVDATGTITAYAAQAQWCQAGTTAVPLATIKAACGDCDIYQGGTWDGTTYTLPASKQPPTTDVGRMEVACREVDESLLGNMREIRNVWSRAYPAAVTNPAITLLLQVRKGIRGVALQTSVPAWTLPIRLAFVQGALGAFGKVEDVLTPFASAWESGGPIPQAPAGRRLVFVIPLTGEQLLTLDAIFLADNNQDARMVADATEQSIWRQAGAWCREITG